MERLTEVNAAAKDLSLVSRGYLAALADGQDLSLSRRIYIQEIISGEREARYDSACLALKAAHIALRDAREAEEAQAAAAKALARDTYKDVYAAWDSSRADCRAANKALLATEDNKESKAVQAAAKARYDSACLAAVKARVACLDAAHKDTPRSPR